MEGNIIFQGPLSTSMTGAGRVIKRLMRNKKEHVTLFIYLTLCIFTPSPPHNRRPTGTHGHFGRDLQYR